MESIKNFLAKVLETPKRLLFNITNFLLQKGQIILSLLVVGLGIYAYYHFYKPNKELQKRFYPIFKPQGLDPKISQVYSLFIHKHYFSTTSYVDDILPLLYDNDSKKWALFFQAESYFILKQYGAAWGKFFTLYSLYPNIWQVKLRLAALQIVKGNYNEANTLLKQIDNSSYEYYYWAGRYWQGKNKLKKALYNYSKADLSNPDVNYRIALLVENKNDNTLMLSFLQKAEVPTYENYPKVLEKIFDIELQNRDVRFINIYGDKLSPYFMTNDDLVRKVSKGFHDIGEIQKAEDTFEKLTKKKYIQPGTAEILVQLNYELKNYPKVIYYSRLFNLTKEDKLYLIDSYLQLKDYFHLLREVKNFMQNYYPTPPQQEALNKMLVFAYINLQQTRLALEKQELVVQINPSVDNLLDLATLYKKIGKITKADYVETLNRVLNKDSGSLKRVMESLKSSNYIDVREQFIEKVLQKDPNNTLALYYKAELYLKKNDVETVKSILTTLVHLNITDKEIAYNSMYSLGSILLTQGRYDDALYWLNKASEIHKNAHVQLRMALGYYYLKDYIKAQQIVKMLENNLNLNTEFNTNERELYNSLDKNIGHLALN